MIRRFCGLLCLLVLPAALAAADNWNQFRGPNGDGKSSAKNVPVKLGEDVNVTWKTKIHGKGWSSPVVWGKQIWMQTATEDGHELFAVCVHAGHRQNHPRHQGVRGRQTEVRPPDEQLRVVHPVLEDGRIYVHFGQYGTACLDTKTGKKIWERRDFKCNDFRGPALVTRGPQGPGLHQL